MGEPVYIAFSYRLGFFNDGGPIDVIASTSKEDILKEAEKKAGDAYGVQVCLAPAEFGKEILPVKYFPSGRGESMPEMSNRLNAMQEIGRKALLACETFSGQPDMETIASIISYAYMMRGEI